MELSGSETVSASVADAWGFLMDVDTVASCFPGFNSLSAKDGLLPGEEVNAWDVVIAGGPLKFHLAVTRSEVRPPNPHVGHMTVVGSGSAPGTKVYANIDLLLTALDLGHTWMEWRATVGVSGVIGSRMPDGVLEKTAASFFACLAEHLTRH